MTSHQPLVWMRAVFKGCIVKGVNLRPGRRYTYLPTEGGQV